MKHIIVLILLCITLTGCVTSKEHPQTQPKPQLNGEYSEEAIKYENKMVACEREMQKLIDKRYTLIEQIDWDDTDKERAFYAACDVIRKFHPALGTGGFRSDSSVPAVYPMAYAPEDYYCWQQSMLSLKDGDAFYEYCLFFEKQYDDVNAQRWCKNLKGLFGITIDAAAFQAGINMCAEKLKTVTPENQYDHELYYKDGIHIKVVAMQYGEEKYITLKATYTHS